MWLQILLLVAGLALLVKGGEVFVAASVRLAEYLRMPRVVIGSTLVSLATISPELVVSVMASAKGQSGLAVGNAVGSCIRPRSRDLSPTRGTIRRQDGSVEERPNTGGGPRFVEFFERELIPYVESHYRTLPYQIFAGHSLGGLFALEALYEKPALFGAVIAVSPALGWEQDWALARLEKFAGEKHETPRTLVVTMANAKAGEAKPTRLDRLEAVLAVGSRRSDVARPADARGGPRHRGPEEPLRGAAADLRRLAAAEGRGLRAGFARSRRDQEAPGGGQWHFL